MKFKMFVLLSVALATVALVLTACTNGSSDKTPPVGSNQNVLYYTCPMHPSVKADKPGSCPICNMTLQPVYGNNAVTNSASAPTNASAARPYPLNTCLVDDMKLGSMGDPYVLVYQGQEIKFCCANCKPEFLKNPDKYLKKIADAQSSQK
jgi:YHS domain-containing protein